MLTIGEILRGIEPKRRRDEVAAHHLDLWLEGLVTSFASRILPAVHGLTLVTRNTTGFEGTGVELFNPFAG